MLVTTLACVYNTTLQKYNVKSHISNIFGVVTVEHIISVNLYRPTTLLRQHCLTKLMRETRMVTQERWIPFLSHRCEWWKYKTAEMWRELRDCHTFQKGHWYRGFAYFTSETNVVLTLLGVNFFWFYEVQRVDFFLKMAENWHHLS